MLARTKPSTVCSFVLRRRLLAPRVSFPLRWFRRVPRRNHPVPCFQLGAFDTIVRLNPWKYDTGMITSPRRLRRHKQPSFGRRYTHSCREIFGILHVVDLFRVHCDTSRPTLRSRSPCASWARPLSGVCAGKPLALLALHLSAREGCPGHCDTPSSYQMVARSFQWHRTDKRRTCTAVYAAFAQVLLHISWIYFWLFSF